MLLYPWLALPLLLGILLAAASLRRQNLRRMAAAVRARDRAVRDGATARLQHPVVDLSRCLGCGACVRACPEAGVLDLVHGQAMVIAGARCVGHATCASSCPVGAITVTLGDTRDRDDIPALAPDLQAIGQDGIYLAGEVTAHALIRTAFEQGVAVADAVAQRRAAAAPVAAAPTVLDLCIVGAGPAGLACALAAKAHGLSFVVLEQEAVIGGTVAKYPRRKLVLTHPVALPLHGALDRSEYEKEELVALWQQIAVEQALPIRTGVELRDLARAADRSLLLTTSRGPVAAHNVCLALGRRGVPQRLGVPGEDLPKVAYALLDAASYHHCRIAVVGGGDSAIETALALAEQDGNTVTLVCRGGSFARARAQNQQRLDAAVAAGHVTVLLHARVLQITGDAIEVAIATPTDGERRQRLGNDHLFAMIGGTPPVPLLQRAGVSFDPALRPTGGELVEQGTGLLPALAASLLVTLVAIAFVVWHGDYYALPSAERPTHPDHALLRPGMGLGLAFGLGATALLAANLLYLLRRIGWGPFRFGSLRTWMTAHVATGILAAVAALLHAALAPRATVGGDALAGLFVLVVTGAIGRYFYAALPRAANGRELRLTELKAELARADDDLAPGERAFATRARAALHDHVEARQWGATFVGRVAALLTGGLRWRRLHRQLLAQGRAEGLSTERLLPMLALAARAHRVATAVAHLEDLRAVLASWRFLHRWIALLTVVLLVVHVVHALTFATLGFGGGP